MPQVYPDFSDNRISNLVTEQLPEFVVEQYPNFVLFLQAYYQWMEQQGNVVNQLKNFPNYIDIDYVVENDLVNFVTEFQQMYMASLPTNMLADKAKVLKNIKQFYSSRGSVKSFEFLFKILFDAPVEIGIPGSQILRASAGQWYQPTVLRIAIQTELLPMEPLGSNFDLGLSILGRAANTAFQPTPISEWVNLQVFGQTSFASAVVSDAQTHITLGIQYTELTVTNVTKSFVPNEIITAMTPDGNTISGTLLGIIPGIIITNPGSKYNVGDPIIITGGGGANANAVVSSISSGSLIGVSVVDGGSGYLKFPNFAVNVIGSFTPTSVQITNVDTSGLLSPNNYTFNSDLLSLNYNEVVLSNTGNTTIVNTWNTVHYSNCGPIVLVNVFGGGSGYIAPPQLVISEPTPIANTGTFVMQYGTIGTLKIINAGANYKVNDDIKIVSLLSRGVAGGGQVTSVNAAGSIQSVYVALPSIDGTVSGSSGANTVTGVGTKFTTELFANNNPIYPDSGSFITINGENKRVANIVNSTFLKVDSNFINSFSGLPLRLQGFPLGGMGYQQSDLPSGVNCFVNSQIGTGAIIQADSILGGGATLDATAGAFGMIEGVTMQNFGDHYTSQPEVSIPGGDGTATGIADLIAAQFSYPGFYLNEDGMLSARRYLENADRYNTYSYTVTSPIGVESYRGLVKNILHPAGSNMVGITNIQGQTPYLNANSAINVYINLGSVLLDELNIDFILDFSLLSGILPGNILGVNFMMGFSVPD